MFSDRLELDRVLERLESEQTLPDETYIHDPIDECFKRIDILSNAICKKHPDCVECEELARLYMLLDDSRYPEKLRIHWPDIKDLLLRLQADWQQREKQKQAGKAKQPTPFQKLIYRAVSNNQNISEKELLEFLDSGDCEGVVDEVCHEEGKIYLKKCGKSHVEPVKISSLRNRLTRAKKKYREKKRK